VPFVRAPRGGRPGQVVAAEHAEALANDLPTLVIGWRTTQVAAKGELAICPHEAGPPKCWCRPPLPGLVLAWARRENIDLSRSIVIASSPTMRQLAHALGCELRASA
jgi:hypothetical protein